MIKKNIADLKNHFSDMISKVEEGSEIQVCRRNIPVAEIRPIRKTVRNRTKLGCGRNSVIVDGDLTEPLIPVDSWLMLQKVPSIEPQ